MPSRKEEISLCAARLFRKKGYKATSMRSIADEVGIKAASIYNHVNSKQEILQDLLLAMAVRFSNEMQAVQDSSLSVEGKLERLIALHIRLTADHTDAIALIAGEWVHLEGEAKTQYIALRDTYEKDFKAILAAGIEEGVLKKIDIDIMLFSTLSTLRWLYSWYRKNKSYNLIELERAMIACLLGGIKKEI